MNMDNNIPKIVPDVYFFVATVTMILLNSVAPIGRWLYFPWRYIWILIIVSGFAFSMAAEKQLHKKNRKRVMNKTLKVTYWLFMVWSALVVISNLNAGITFGHGLGDIYCLVLLLLLIIVISIVVFKVLRNTSDKISIISFLLFILGIVIVFSLKLTVYRGPEYPWNGELFLWTVF